MRAALVLLALCGVSAVCATINHVPMGPQDINGFPADFDWCTATAAYQIEGGQVDGYGGSIWDTYAAKSPSPIADKTSGKDACDSYHKVEQDVALLKAMKVKSYRFSIAPPRILPTGKLAGGVNQKGIEYYSKLIGLLEANGIRPMVTLYHWDLQDALEKAYGGWTSPLIVQDFVDYARVVFEHFAPRVGAWITFNEPWCQCWQGYGTPWKAPGRDSAPLTDPYLAGHYMLLAHARTVEMYRREFAHKFVGPKGEKGTIGITLNSEYTIPGSDSVKDKLAAQRYVEFMLGWFADPVYFGDYPESMKMLVGDRLPKFTAEEKKLLKGSSEFFGINAYTTLVATDQAYAGMPGWDSDRQVATSHQWPNGSNYGVPAASPWLFYTPDGFTGLLKWISVRYGYPPILVTENGVSVPGEGPKTIATGALDDGFRVQFYRGYLQAMRAAINQGIRVKTYCAWSLMDNFEWADGYTNKFGTVYVNMTNNFERTPKLSYNFLADVFSNQESLDHPSEKYQYTMPAQH